MSRSGRVSKETNPVAGRLEQVTAMQQAVTLPASLIAVRSLLYFAMWGFPDGEYNHYCRPRCGVTVLSRLHGGTSQKPIRLQLTQARRSQMQPKRLR